MVENTPAHRNHLLGCQRRRVHKTDWPETISFEFWQVTVPTEPSDRTYKFIQQKTYKVRKIGKISLNKEVPFPKKLGVESGIQDNQYGDFLAAVEDIRHACSVHCRKTFVSFLHRPPDKPDKSFRPPLPVTC